MADRRFRDSTTTSICCKCLESDFLVIKKSVWNRPSYRMKTRAHPYRMPFTPSSWRQSTVEAMRFNRNEKLKRMDYESHFY